VSDAFRSDDAREEPAGPVPSGSPPDGAPSPSGPSQTGHPPAPPSVADDLPPSEEQGELSEVLELDVLRAEREEYLALARRTQAEFENFRKQNMKRQADQVALAASGLVEKLLPALDACDAALAHDAAEVKPIFTTLLGILEKEGLERVDPLGEPFDPNEHEAVVHEPGDGDGKEEISEVLRVGYRWKGRVLRPAMVKVRS
jgi:molecular chaperone GrpE